jgi:hypothetical protein
VFNAIFSNISAISWQPVLVVEEAGVPRREPPTMGKQLVNFITCGCESSDGNSAKLYMIAYNHRNINISLKHFNWTVYVGIIAPF